jgi:hypothetical protein
METESLFISCGANTVSNGILWLDTLDSSTSSSLSSPSPTYLAYASANLITLVNFFEKVRDPSFFMTDLS